MNTQTDSEKIKAGKQSLHGILETIGPFLPNKDTPIIPASSKWRLEPELVVPHSLPSEPESKSKEK